MESTATFKVSGTVRLGSRKDPGNPRRWGGVPIEILDLDRFRHDLLASGTTRRDGSFELSFVVDEFNLDAGEDEHLPDLWLTCFRVAPDGDRIPIESCSIPWVPGDLRTAHVDVVIDEWMTSLPSGEDVPRASVRSSPTLDLTPELLAVLAEEIAPEVTRLTGWEDLTDGLRFAVGDEMTTVNRHVMRHISVGPQRLLAPVIDYFGGLWVAAVFDPTTRTILVNERLADVNSDGLRVLLAHELVHAGQFRAHPALVDELSAAAGELLGLVEAGSADGILGSRAQAIGTECEGQAMWVQRRIQGDLHLARAGMSLNWFSRMVQAALLRAQPEKAQQYTHGLALMERRGTDEGGFPQLSPSLLGPAAG